MQDWRSELLGQELDPSYQDLRAQNPEISVPETRELTSSSRAPVFESNESFDIVPRRMTIKSAKALDKIQLLEAELAGFVKALQANFKQVRSHLATPKDLYKVKSVISQFSGVLEKFQYVKVDSIITADLTTGKDEAKLRRKKMNKQCEVLRDGIKELLEELEARVRNMEPVPLKASGADEDEEEDLVQTGQPISQLVQRASMMEKPKPVQSSPENPQSDHMWLDKLPEARVALNLDVNTGKKKPMFPGAKVHSRTVAKARASTAQSLRTSLETLQEFDDYDSSDDIDLDEMDGKMIRPEWDDIKTFVKLYSPDKASCKRYEVGMASASIKADMKVLEFLYTPSAHANSLRLSDRPMKTQELDLLGRLFSSQWHHACKLREFYLDNMTMKDSHIQKLCSYLPDFDTLEVLSLNNNYITDVGAVALSSAIVHIRPLTMLSLEGNKIKSQGIVSLSETITRLPNLSILNLSHNPIGDYGAYALAAALTSRSPSGYDWEPNVPEKPTYCSPVKVNMGRATSFKARGIEIAKAAAKRLTGVPPPPGGMDPRGNRPSTITSPPPGPPPIRENRPSTVVAPPPGRPGRLSEGASGDDKAAEVHVAAKAGLPDKRVSSLPPPKREVAARVSVVQRGSMRPSAIGPPPGSLRPANAGAAAKRRTGQGGFLDMVVEEDGGEEDDDKKRLLAEKRKSRQPSARASRMSSVLASSPQIAKVRSSALTAKEKVAKMKADREAAKAEEDARASATALEKRVRQLWTRLRFWSCVIGRMCAVQRGSAPVAVLNVANCKFGPLGIQWLMHSCKFNQSVSTLNLSDNGLDYESAVIIAEYLMWCDTLDELILDGNIFEDKGMQVLLKGVESNKSLSSLSMDRCSLTAVSLNWISSMTQSYYIDNILLVRDVGISSAGVKLDNYTEQIEDMGGLVEKDRILQLDEEAEGLY